MTKKLGDSSNNNYQYCRFLCSSLELKYSLRYVHYRFSALAMNFGTQPYGSCAQNVITRHVTHDVQLLHSSSKRKS